MIWTHCDPSPLFFFSESPICLLWLQVKYHWMRSPIPLPLLHLSRTSVLSQTAWLTSLGAVLTVCPVQRRFRGNISPCCFARAKSRVGRGKKFATSSGDRAGGQGGFPGEGRGGEATLLLKEITKYLLHCFLWQWGEFALLSFCSYNRSCN